MTFPEGFLWGTTSSATQVQGAADHSDWFRWEQQGHAPRSLDGNGFSTLFAEDFSLLAEHGLSNHMLTLDWARLEPEQGRLNHNAVEHYTEILRSARDRGIEIWASLHHFTLPGWFSDDEGGYLDDHARSYHWARHVDRTAEMFADLVAGFIPIHEPLTYAHRAFLTGTFPPGRLRTGEFLDALRATHLANAEAWRLLRSGSKPVMTVMDLCPVFPGVTSRHPDEREVATQKAALVDQFIWGSWIGALRDGILELPGRVPEEVPAMADSFDLIGFTYRDALTVRADLTTAPYPEESQAGPTARAPWPEGMAITIRRLADELPRRALVVAGCNLTSRSSQLEDTSRVHYLEDCLHLVSAAVDDGIDIRGFFHDGAVDGYEWQFGNDVHSGLFDRSRNPRHSALLMQRWAETTK